MILALKKPLKSAGYDKGEPRKLEKFHSVLPTKLVDESTVMQGMINGEFSTQHKLDLGYSHSPIPIKLKNASSNPIMIQICECKDENATQPCASAFDRLGKQDGRETMFDRLNREASSSNAPQKASVFTQLRELVYQSEPSSLKNVKK